MAQLPSGRKELRLLHVKGGGLQGNRRLGAQIDANQETHTRHLDGSYSWKVFAFASKSGLFADFVISSAFPLQTATEAARDMQKALKTLGVTTKAPAKPTKPTKPTKTTKPTKSSKSSKSRKS